MALVRDRRRGIPLVEPDRLRGVSRRTLLLRAALAGALCAALALILAAAFRQDVRRAPLVPTGTTGIVVLDLSASVYEGALDRTVEKLARTNERTGLVVFSDAAYELLPPGSPARELFPLLRYFKARPDATLPPNPWEDFRAGTRISEGLVVAREALHREKVTNGSIVLVSDLEILPDEIARVSEVLAELEIEGTQVRIVPVSPRPETRALVERLVGKDAFLAEPEHEATDVRAPEERTFEGSVPWLFMLAAGLFIGVMGANERMLSRLEVKR